uniref:cytochrome c oxidase subunit II n=1 Tax=Abscondita chinensis TaxID=2599921 RepID=UPI002237E4B7|nr:cytochrome c oxidase subunit II [Abscondita chinensis]UYG18638.1 cytochrome c oxidase subunit 2 [Abscondita chinensis]UYG49067.1 cytochrome c oxidase subunit 2 [Abscondita chinensis]UYG49080.1 cytochrome c oxidase subunit 2 [Abscondita chinensis]UYG49093.1 cytochrome c oxidase subunit 2 [Abscondita chinensis]UYG49106.1 cytochrome c oxidase subunit 2 [Abscondita chinensis]
MATWMNLNSQDSISPLMEQLTFFHDHTMMILTIITLIVMYIMVSMMINKYINRLLLEGQMIELIWTISPAITLIFIALPSLQLLYLLDEINLPLVSVKSMGHQWYWSYEFSDFKKAEFDSYMIPANEQKNSSFRLLEVDNRLTLPIYTQIRMMVSSSDVIHSWTIPSSSVKIDATPGRLNQTTFFMNRIGLFFGQCSEICGMNHSFMPIVVESILPKYFIEWVKNI